MSISDKVVALDFRKKIAEGTPAEVQRDPGRDPRLSRDRPPDGRDAARGGNLQGRLRRHRRRCTGSISRRRRRHHTLLGANGAGKTTTLRALCGMVRTSGDIRFDGERDRRQGNRGHRAARHRPCAARAAARSSRLTVEENLQLGAMTRRDGRDRRRFRARLRLFPAPEGAPPPAGRHAVGRRAADAGGRPRPDAAAALMLLDEPSFGLAPLVVRGVFGILRAAQPREKVSMLLVEQNAALALDLADHAYLLETGASSSSGPRGNPRR